MWPSGWRWVYVLMVPGGVVFLAALVCFRPEVVPVWAQPPLSLLPAIVFIFGLVLGWVTDRARTVMAMLVLVAADRALGFFPTGAASPSFVGTLLFTLVAILLPVNLLLLSAIGDRGLLSRTTYTSVGFLFAQIGLAWWLSQPSGHEAAQILLAPAAIGGWFDWTPLPSAGLFAFAGALATGVVQFVVSPTVVTGSALWALLTSFVALHGTSLGWAPAHYFGAAGIMLCWASVAAHYRATYRDELTGIRGHAALDRALDNLGRRYAIAILDIDHLREVNHAYSEAIGDMVLQQVADVLAAVSGGGKAFRYSGEEFAILFPERSSADALLVMEHLRRKIEQCRLPAPARRAPPRSTGLRQPRDSSPGTISVTVSIGIADSFEHPTNVSDVIRAAYRALALAKLDGGNRVTRATQDESIAKPKIAARRA